MTPSITSVQKKAIKDLLWMYADEIFLLITSLISKIIRTQVSVDQVHEAKIKRN